MTGKIVSIYGTTATVAVSHEYRHPIYKKSVSRTKKVAARVEKADVKVGDTVTLTETRPLSKRIHFKIV